VPAPEFAPALADQLADVQALRNDAEQRGWTSEVERHSRVIERLQEHLGRLDITPDSRPAACSNPHGRLIESTFATVRLRQRVTKGPGSRAAGIGMAFKLIESAQHRWHAVNSAHLVALVRAGAKFGNAVLVERPDESASGDAHAA
jgi:hypothetical protein